VDHSILEQIAGVVGWDNVITDPDLLKSYGGTRDFISYRTPEIVVKAYSGPEVEQLVAIAIEHRIPVTPVSSAPPHTSPGSAPSVDGAMVIDLSGMKKIISVNRRFCVAVIEPGVTYGELNAALTKEGLYISMPLAPRDGKSVISSLLNVEPRRDAAKQWNYIDPLRCMEVTWGDGERMFTGEAGGGIRDLEKQQAQGKWQINGGGPMMLDFCRLLTGSQGTMGIVTWASVKCEPLSTRRQEHLVTADSPDALIDFTYELLRLRFADGLFLLNRACCAILAGGRDPGAAPWQAVVEIDGHQIFPELRIEQQTLDIRDIAEKYHLAFSDPVPLKTRLDSGGGLGRQVPLFFVTTLDQTPRFIRSVEKAAKEVGYPVERIGIYIQPQHQGTSCHCEFIFPADPETAEAAKQLYFKAAEAVVRQGGFFSRPQGNVITGLQLGKDAQTAKTLGTMRGIFDPHHIMNPGKLEGKQVNPL